MKTKEEILQANTSAEVLRWLQALPPPHPPEVAEYFNYLAAKELREYIGPDYDPETHYDIPKRKRGANDAQNHP